MKPISQQACTAFRAYLIQTEKASATVEKYTRDAERFCRRLGARPLCKEAVLAYKAKLLRTYAPASVNATLSSLNAFFVFAGRSDCRVKALRIQRRQFASEERELSKAEYERLLSAAQQKNRRLWLAMQAICSTGIRISELQYITAEAAARGKADVRNKGKARQILLSQALCRALLQYAKEQDITEGPIFRTRSGKPLDRSNVWGDMKSLCKAAGVDPRKVFPHNLRHLFSRTHYLLYKDVVHLADLLGHASINTTRIYTRENICLYKQQIENLDLLKC